MIHEHVPNAHSWTLVQITITIRRLVPFQFHGGTSIDRSIYRFHEHLWSIRISGEGRRLQTTRIRRARDGSANEESQRRLDPAFFARKTCVTNFFFIRHTPLPSPPSSALYTPLFLSRSTTRRPRSFLSIFFEIPSSLSRRVRSQPEEEEVLLLEVYVRYELRLFRVSSSSNEDDYNPFSFFVAFHFSAPQNERDAFFFFTVMHGKINGKEGLINFLSTLDFSLIVNRYWTNLLKPESWKYSREGWDNFLLLQFLQLRRISIRECNFARLPRFLHDTYDFVPRTKELEKKWYERIFNIYRGKINFFKVKYVEGVFALLISLLRENSCNF